MSQRTRQGWRSLIWKTARSGASIRAYVQTHIADLEYASGGECQRTSQQEISQLGSDQDYGRSCRGRGAAPERPSDNLYCGRKRKPAVPGKGRQCACEHNHLGAEEGKTRGVLQKPFERRGRHNKKRQR